MNIEKNEGVNTTQFESRDILKRERVIDAENAKREAFGEPDGEILKQLEYESFRNAMIIIRGMGEKMTADTKFSELLRKGVSRKLRVDIEYVKIFKTTGTIMDKFHKISAWVEFPNTDGKLICITLDIFTEEKNKRTKADIVFRKPEKGFNDPSNDQFMTTLEEVISMIVKTAKRRGFNNSVEVGEDVGYQRAVIDPKKSRVVKFDKDE